MEEVKYTLEQLSAIETLNQNLLVSAAAGSGKTTIMIERVARLVESGVPIKKFLIISFTKASAADMKNKLIKKLSCLKQTPFILEQLDDILTADVSNLHSFCARLLKAYFFEVGLDPTFVVLDDIEVDAAKEKAFERVIKNIGENGNEDFFELIDIFSKNRNISGLKDVVFKVYDFLHSIVDPEEWKNKTLNELYNPNLKDNSAAKVILSHIRAERIRLKNDVDRLLNKYSLLGEKKLVAYLNEIDSYILAVRLDADFEKSAEVLNNLPAFSRFPTAESGKEEFYKEVVKFRDEVKDRYDKLKDYVLGSNYTTIAANLAVTKERVKHLFELENIFENEFCAIKKEKGGLDFNDLEQNTLKVLQNPTLLEEIKNKYEYVLVDEYQDINGVQEEILRLLSKTNNRFMVGDIKQSIYRFRLCDPEIFLEKYNSFAENSASGKLIKLNANFRSKKAILDFVNTIFVNTMTEEFGGVDYEKDAQLKGDDADSDEERVKFLFADCKKDEDTNDISKIYSVKEDDGDSVDIDKAGRSEGIMIAAEIADLVAHKKIKDKETGKMRTMKYSDITILTKSRNPFLKKVVETIEAEGIPVSTDIESDCLDDEYVYGIKCFLESVANYNNDYSLFGCLFSKLFNFSADELAKIKMAGNGDYFYKSVLKALENLEGPLRTKLENFFARLSEAKNKASYLSAKELAEDIIKKQDIELKISFDKSPDKRRQKLNRYLSSLEDMSVYDYVLDSSMAEIKIEPSPAYGSVRVMTIHKSKGLEFGAVFLVMANKTFNFKSLSGDVIISKDLGLAMNYFDDAARYKISTLAKEAVKLIERRKFLEEQQRLLYVALTRATDYLFIVGSGNINSVRKDFAVSPTCFMDFMAPLLSRPEKFKDIKYSIYPFDADELTKNISQKEERQVIFGEFDDEEVSAFKNVLGSEYGSKASINVPVKTAVTSIADEEGGVVMFDDEEKDLSSSASLGTLQHKFMEKLSLSENRKQLEKRAESLAEMGYFAKEDIKNIMFDGIEKLLKNEEFSGLVSSANKIMKEQEFYMLVSAKEYFGGCEGDGVVVQGVVDLILFNGDGLTIVDYKSGKIASQADKYEKQINLYAEAIERSFNQKVVRKFIASLKTGSLIKVD